MVFIGFGPDVHICSKVNSPSTSHQISNANFDHHVALGMRQICNGDKTETCACTSVRGAVSGMAIVEVSFARDGPTAWETVELVWHAR